MYFELDLTKLKRESPFPPPIAKVFYSRGLILPTGPAMGIKNIFEFCLRLQSEAKICSDVIDGRKIHVPYPHAVWKLPMQKTSPGDQAPRDVLALLYPHETGEVFRNMGLVPEDAARSFVMNAEISFLVEKFIRLINNLYSPGVADRLDWLGFSLMKEVLFASGRSAGQLTMEQKIRNIALWLQNHSGEDPDFHQLARQHNLNYTQFYREWNRVIGMTPYQYVLQARLKAAADLLDLTDQPVSKIIEMVNFSGHYAFYRRFEEKYGMTPLEYRRHVRKK